MRKVITVLVVLIFAVSFIGNVPEVQAAEPSLAQCQGEPSKGTGWGTFWMVYGLLNAASGAALYGVADDYENISKGTSIGAIVVGGVLAGIGMNMRSSANSYNEACANLLSGRSLERGFGLEPIAKEATGMKLVYRW